MACSHLATLAVAPAARRCVLPALIALVGIPAAAQEPPKAARGETLGALRGFADAFFKREMAQRRIPGAVLVVVHGDSVVLSRGYGYADLERRIPVDPDRTLFRVGSVSKLLTATAALQLVERGQLHLHADVNEYSGPLRIAPAFGAPVTLHHLLTHTAGFEERLIGLAAPDAAGLGTMAAMLADEMPTRVRPPGISISYSNHGSALVGHLIEQVSGMPFHEYVRRHVQEPIGMTRSGFRPSPDMLDDLATGVEIVGDNLRPIPRDAIRLEPAGSFVSTGADMGRFLLAHLGGGALREARILAAETSRTMHRPQAGHPGVATFAYGFYGNTTAGQTILMHTGGWRDFRSLMFLLPEADVGVFLSYNRADEGPVEMQQAFMTNFLRRFAPPTQAITQESPAGDERTHTVASRGVTGHFRYIRHSHTTAEKLLALAGDHVRVTRGTGDTLVARGLTAHPISLTSAGGGRYLRSDGLGHVLFEDIGRTGAMRLMAGPDLPLVYERLRWWETRNVQLVFIALMLILYASALVRIMMAGWAWGARRLRSRTPPADAGPRAPSAAWAAAAAGSLLNLVFLVAFPVAFLGQVVGGIPEFVYGMPRSAELLLVFPWISVPVALTVLWLTIGAIRNREGSLAARVHLGSVTVMLALFIPFAQHWRLMPLPG